MAAILGWSGTLALVLWAAAGGGNSLDLPNWAQWGILGAAVVALSTGKFLVPAWTYKNEREARLAAEERERALREGVVQASLDAQRETRDVLNRVMGFMEAHRQ